MSRHVRRVILEIRGEDPKAVESLEQHFSEALSDRLARMGGEPRFDEAGDMTGVVDLWGCTVEEVDLDDRCCASCGDVNTVSIND